MSLILFLVCTEVFSFIYLEANFPDIQNLRNELKGDQRELRHFGYSAHPVFTFVSNKPESNNLGFFSPYSYPYIKKPNDFVIGIFGGSVAENLADMANEQNFFSTALKTKIKKLKDKNLIFLNYAAGCGKQPMQFDRFAYFADGLDFAINLDGYNEIAFNQPQSGATYPCFMEPYLRDGTSMQYLVAEEQLVGALINMNASLITSRAFDHSYTVLLAVKTLISVKYKLYSYFDKKLWPKQIEYNPKLFPLQHDKSEKDFFLLGADNWAKYAFLQLTTAKALKVPSLFVLQPNINLIDSKVLSSEEKAMPAQIRSNGSDWTDLDVHITRGYGRLKNHLSGLQQKFPLNFVDMTEIFKNEKDTMYSDHCCHYNDAANRKIVEQLARAMTPVVQ